MKKILLIVLMCIFLIGCDSAKEVLCGSMDVEQGNMELISRQCVDFKDTTTAIYTFKDKTTGKIYVYTANYVDSKVVMNLSTSDAITIANSEAAAANSAMAAGFAAGAMGMSSGRR